MTTPSAVYVVGNAIGDLFGMGLEMILLVAYLILGA